MAEYLEGLSDPVSVHRVAANWLLDLDQYNEWMNESDYEVDSTGMVLFFFFFFFF